MDIVKQQLNNWWGLPTSSYASQRTLLWEDIATNCIKNNDGTVTHRYFIGEKQVCRSFYMRARGIHNGTLFEMESDIRKKKTQGLGAILKDQKLSENTRGQKIRDMKTWLTLFCKHVGDKVPVENMIVVPYKYAYR